MVNEMQQFDKMDMLEVELLASGPLIDCPVFHRFTNGMYSRYIVMEQFAYVTSKIHVTQHQFAILKGKATIYSDNDGEITVEAPYLGITLPGTRRALFIHEECHFVTFHPTDITPENDSQEALLEAVNKIEQVIIQPHENLALKYVKENIINE